MVFIWFGGNGGGVWNLEYEYNGKMSKAFERRSKRDGFLLEIKIWYCVRTRESKRGAEKDDCKNTEIDSFCNNIEYQWNSHQEDRTIVREKDRDSMR